MTDDDIKDLWDNAEQIIVSQEDYDYLVQKLNEPADPKTLQSLKKLLQRKSPWN